jgi:hypothetical protein
VADKDHLEAFAAITRYLQVNLGYQRAGGVEYPKPPLLCVLANAGGNAVRAEDHSRAGGNLVKLVDEDSATALQAVDDETVVYHLVTDVDGGAVELQDTLDDFDCPVDAGAEAARVG